MAEIVLGKDEIEKLLHDSIDKVWGNSVTNPLYDPEFCLSFEDELRIVRLICAFPWLRDIKLAYEPNVDDDPADAENIQKWKRGRNAVILVQAALWADPVMAQGPWPMPLLQMGDTLFHFIADYIPWRDIPYDPDQFQQHVLSGLDQEAIMLPLQGQFPNPYRPPKQKIVC